MKHKKLGLIVNPVAGLGGSVGLKGSDGMVEEALARGAVPQSERRAEVALQELLEIRDSITVYTGPGSMGGDLAEQMGFSCVIMEDRTAAATTAGRLALLYLQGQVVDVAGEDVLDIDEEQYRQERINTRLYGCLRIPRESDYTQCRKCSSSSSEEDSIAAIADYVADTMKKDTFYIIGAGTTTRAVMRELELENTLIGVDLVYNYELVAADIYGKQILELIGDKPVKLVVTVTGGQGFLFGRGNQQLIPEVLRRVGKENIIILATKDKIVKLRGQPLLVDTGDAQLDRYLSGYHQVICDYNETIVCKVCPG